MGHAKAESRNLKIKTKKPARTRRQPKPIRSRLVSANTAHLMVYKMRFATSLFGSDFMPKYMVNSAILRSGKNPKACAEGAAKMLAAGKVKNVEMKSCYCCGPEGRVAFVIEAPSRDEVLEALAKLDIPVASIMETEELAMKK